MWRDYPSDDDDQIVTTWSAFIRRFVPETCAVLLFFLFRLKSSRNACSLFSLPLVRFLSLIGFVYAL